MVKNPPEIWETCVPSLGWEDPLEKEMATYSNILARIIPRTEESVELQSKEVTKESDMTEQLSTHIRYR